MFTGTPEQYAAAQATAVRIAEEIRDLLNQLDAVHPGSTSGVITGLGVELRQLGGTWQVR